MLFCVEARVHVRCIGCNGAFILCRGEKMLMAFMVQKCAQKVPLRINYFGGVYGSTN